jgi:hypothetical protein
MDCGGLEQRGTLRCIASRMWRLSCCEQLFIWTEQDLLPGRQLRFRETFQQSSKIANQANPKRSKLAIRNRSRMRGY